MSLKRIDEIFHFEKGVLQSSKCIPGDYDFITASSDWKTHNEYTHECEALIFAAAASGSLGRTHYVNGKFVSSDLCFIITPKDPVNFPIDLRFYHILFNELKDEIVRNTKAGTSKEAIGLGSFGKYKLPYFDIDKQIEIKNRFVNSEVTKEELSTELTHQLTLVKKLRQQLLQDAVQGKLVPQNPNDEPASELLKKIKAEKQKLIAEGKLKKEKELPPIKAEEIPFEIPEGWVWCKVGELTTSIVPNRDKPLTFTGDINWITQANFSDDVYKLNYKLTGIGLSQEEVKKYNCRVMPVGSIVMSCVGQFDLVCLVEKEIVANQQLHCFVPYCNVEPMYLCYAVKYFSKFIEKEAIQTTIKYINKTKCESILIPLPSLSEQHRIVQKLDELMQTCDALEASIKESAEQNERLLQQVLREALQKDEIVKTL